MRAIMHQDCKAKLAGADQHDGQHIRERVGQHGNHRNRTKDHRPGMNNEPNSLPCDASAQDRKLLLRNELPRGYPKHRRSHDGGHWVSFRS
jgi:hypothetical protein